MKKTFCKIIFFFFFVASLVFSTSLVSADSFAPKPLEISYPAMVNAIAPQTIATPAPQYFKYVFVFLIAISGLLALGVLIYAGFLWITSAGNAQRINDAKTKIFAAITGMGILFASWLILNTVNPQLVNISLEPLSVIPTVIEPGIILCSSDMDQPIWDVWRYNESLKKLSPESRPKKLPPSVKEEFKNIDDNCESLSYSGLVPGWLKGKIKYVYTIPFLEEKVDEKTGGTTKETTFYGAILYQDEKMTNSSQVIYNVAIPEPVGFLVNSKIQPLSAQKFQLSKTSNPTDSVVLYEQINENQGASVDNSVKLECKVGSGNCQISPDNFASRQGLTEFIISRNEREMNKKSNKQIGSIEITGDLIVVLFKKLGSDWTENTEVAVLTKSEKNLRIIDPIKNWCAEGYLLTKDGWKWQYFPCAGMMVIINGKVI